MKPTAAPSHDAPRFANANVRCPRPSRAHRARLARLSAAVCAISDYAHIGRCWIAGRQGQLRSHTVCSPPKRARRLRPASSATAASTWPPAPPRRPQDVACLGEPRAERQLAPANLLEPRLPNPRGRAVRAATLATPMRRTPRVPRHPPDSVLCVRHGRSPRRGQSRRSGILSYPRRPRQSGPQSLLRRRGRRRSSLLGRAPPWRVSDY